MLWEGRLIGPPGFRGTDGKTDWPRCASQLPRLELLQHEVLPALGALPRPFWEAPRADRGFQRALYDSTWEGSEKPPPSGIQASELEGFGQQGAQHHAHGVFAKYSQFNSSAPSDFANVVLGRPVGEVLLL